MRDPKEPLSSVSLGDYAREAAANAAAPLFAGQKAVRDFRALPAAASRTFLQTRRKLSVVAWPGVLTFGMGKAAAAHMIQCASMAYEPHGFRSASSTPPRPQTSREISF